MDEYVGREDGPDEVRTSGDLMRLPAWQLVSPASDSCRFRASLSRMPEELFKLLFVGSENFHRSRAREEVFKSKPGFLARSAGTWDSSRHRIDDGDLEWADLVLVMEKSHQDEIKRLFPDWVQGSRHKIEVLDIPDAYWSAGALEVLKPVCETVVLERLRKRRLT